MTAIGPGTLLRCIKAPSFTQPGYDFLMTTVGSFYLCERVVDSIFLCPEDGCGHEGLVLKDKSRFKCIDGCGTMHTALYCPNLFRPVDDGDTSLVRDEEIPPIHAPPVRICEEV